MLVCKLAAEHHCIFSENSSHLWFECNISVFCVKEIFATPSCTLPRMQTVTSASMKDAIKSSMDTISSVLGSC